MKYKIMKQTKEQKTVKYRANGKVIKVLPETKKILDKITLKPSELKHEPPKRKYQLAHK